MPNHDFYSQALDRLQQEHRKDFHSGLRSYYSREIMQLEQAWLYETIRRRIDGLFNNIDNITGALGRWCNRF